MMSHEYVYGSCWKKYDITALSVICMLFGKDQIKAYRLNKLNIKMSISAMQHIPEVVVLSQ